MSGAPDSPATDVPSTGGAGWIFGMSRLYVLGVLALLSLLYFKFGTTISCDIGGVRYFGMTDEQFISMRYGRNLAQGHGLVWNPGEAPVEGYTNFLWAVWMAVGHLLPIPETHIALWVVASSAVCLLGAAMFCAGIAHRLRPQDAIAPSIALVVCGVYFPALRWSLSGFEVGALEFACAAALYCALGRAPGQPRLRGLWLACSVGVLLRLDAAIWIAACCGLAFAEADRPMRKRLILEVALPLGIVVALFTAWRLSTYGEWLPNTYVLKATGVGIGTRLSQGLGFVGDTFETHFGLLVLPVALAFATPGDAPWRRRLVLGVWLSELAYTVWIGGDTWEERNFANRPLTIAIPALFALVALGFANAYVWISERRGRVWAAAACGVGLVAIIWSHDARNLRRWMKFDHCRAPLMNKIRRALAIRDVVPPDTRIAVVWAGVLPYFTNLPSIDMLGKSDAVIARSKPRGTRSGHNKWDYYYSVGELKPDIITSLYYPTKQERQFIAEQGYREDAFGVWWHERLAAHGVALPESKGAKATFKAKDEPKD